MPEKKTPETESTPLHLTPELFEGAIKAALKKGGVPETIDMFTAVNVSWEIGRALRPVLKQFRPNIVAHLRRLAHESRKDGKPTAESVLIESLIGSWQDFGATGEETLAAFVAALQDAPAGKRAH